MTTNLTPDKLEALLAFRCIAADLDEETAIRILQQHSWDLDVLLR